MVFRGSARRRTACRGASRRGRDRRRFQQAAPGRAREGAGRLRRERAPALPDVPTFTEAGIKGFDSNGWNGFLLPKGTPQPIVEPGNREIAAIVASPEIAQRYEQLGFIAPEPNAGRFRRRDRRE